MKIEVSRVEVNDITPLRELYRQEMNCQIVHDSFPRRGFSDPYLLCVEGRTAGYGLVANRHDPDTMDEFYLFPDYRAAALPLFRQLLEVSQATRIRAQSNDRLMLLMLYDCAANITSDTILFEDALTTHLTCSTGKLRKVIEADKARLFEHKAEPEGDWIIESEGVAVATGGALFHYNPPYGDLYMEVAEPYRRRGYGSYLVQELKRACYEMGKLPAARCNAANVASRKTMQKAGLLPCGRILVGDVVK
ncbi:MAG: GNAT family N-acetyltransferase [Dehalococcoidia bacterium]